MAGLVEQVGAEDGHGRGALDFLELRGGELRLALADVQGVVIHRRESPQNVAIFDQVVILVPADGVADIHAQRPGGRLGVEHRFEPGQAAELADETAARFQPAIRVAGEINRQIER